MNVQVANATWVTDEFESEDYEQGNMELIHDAYLWDGEGRPTVMPSEPPAEELGEGSEEWDEFYDGVRPRWAECRASQCRAVLLASSAEQQSSWGAS